MFQPNLARYQEKQRSLPFTSSAGKKKKSPTPPPSSSEPDTKKTRKRDMMAPLDRTTSPLPNLPEELKEKQEKIDSVAQVNGRMQAGSAKQAHMNGTATSGHTSLSKTDDFMLEGLRDPLQIIGLVRQKRNLGFLYMTPAVDRSSIEYNPYNLK